MSGSSLVYSTDWSSEKPKEPLTPQIMLGLAERHAKSNFPRRIRKGEQAVSSESIILNHQGQVEEIKKNYKCKEGDIGNYNQIFLSQITLEYILYLNRYILVQTDKIHNGLNQPLNYEDYEQCIPILRDRLTELRRYFSGQQQVDGEVNNDIQLFQKICRKEEPIRVTIERHLSPLRSNWGVMAGPRKK